MSLLITNATVLTVDAANRVIKDGAVCIEDGPYRRGRSERGDRSGTPRRRARYRRHRQGRPARLHQHPQPRRLHLLPRARRGHGARLRHRPVLPDGDGREPRGTPRGRLAHLRGTAQERGDHDARDGRGSRRLRPLRRIARRAQLHGRHDLRRRRRCDGEGRVPLRRDVARDGSSAKPSTSRSPGMAGPTDAFR